MSSAGPMHRVQSAQEVYGFPQGHLGHLTQEEEVALDSFKVLLTSSGIYKPQNDDQYGVHDDATLLRFLRARRFVVQDAYKQFKDTEDWRNANQIDILYNTIDLDNYDETRRLYPQWTGRRDRRGIPVYVFEVKHLNSKTMATYEKSSLQTHSKATTDGKTPSKLLRLFALYENLLRFALPLCTALTDRENPATPITQSNNIVDISGVGLKQFWNLRVHMQDASTLATAHYPETLDRIFIIGAPAFFPTVWGWIKRWFDPITTSKIFILSNLEMQETLQQFIDPANIPKKYGGELEFEFGDMPVLDPALKDLITWEGSHKDFPRGPLYWHNRGEFIELEAAGTTANVERSDMVCKLKKPTPENVYNEKHGTTANTALPRSAIIAPELLRAPTEKEGVSTAAENTNIPPIPYGGAAIPTTNKITINRPEDEVVVPEISSSKGAKSEPAVVEAGELVPASRPEPVSFVTARDNLQTTSAIQDKPTEETPLLNGPAAKLRATLMDDTSALTANRDDNLTTLPITNAIPSVPVEEKNDTSGPSTANSKELKEETNEIPKPETTSVKKSASLRKRILGKLKH